MGEIHNTQFFRAVQEKKMDVSQVLELVYAALREKGYNPVNQIVGSVSYTHLDVYKRQQMSW